MATYNKAEDEHRLLIELSMTLNRRTLDIIQELDGPDKKNVKGNGRGKTREPPQQQRGRSNSSSTVSRSRDKVKSLLLSYMRLYQVVRAFSALYPSMKRRASLKVQEFAKYENKRSKDDVPDLGAFLLYLFLSDCTWQSVSGQVVDELLVGSV
jgi:hypothetical protein